MSQNKIYCSKNLNFYLSINIHNTVFNAVYHIIFYTLGYVLFLFFIYHFSANNTHERRITIL